MNGVLHAIITRLATKVKQMIMRLHWADKYTVSDGHALLKGRGQSQIARIRRRLKDRREKT